jgi:hypothetical protein
VVEDKVVADRGGPVRVARVNGRANRPPEVRRTGPDAQGPQDKEAARVLPCSTAVVMVQVSVPDPLQDRLPASDQVPAASVHRERFKTDPGLTFAIEWESPRPARRFPEEPVPILVSLSRHQAI